MIELSYQNNFTPLDEVVYSKWMELMAFSENKTIGELSVVFCSDEFLLKINQNHLNHDTYTDIITYDYSENGLINGEIYISTERAKENAGRCSVSEIKELQRVMAHGV